MSLRPTSNSYCTLCNDAVEYCLHILRDYKLAKEVWTSIIDPRMVPQFFQVSIHDWIKDNFSTTINDGVADGWERRFVSVIWWLWKWRNGCIFNKTFISLQRKIVHLGHIWNAVESTISL